MAKLPVKQASIKPPYVRPGTQRMFIIQYWVRHARNGGKATGHWEAYTADDFVSYGYLQHNGMFQVEKITGIRGANWDEYEMRELYDRMRERGPALPYERIRLVCFLWGPIVEEYANQSRMKARRQAAAVNLGSQHG